MDCPPRGMPYKGFDCSSKKQLCLPNVVDQASSFIAPGALSLFLHNQNICATCSERNHCGSSYKSTAWAVTTLPFPCGTHANPDNTRSTRFALSFLSLKTPSLPTSYLQIFKFPRRQHCWTRCQCRRFLIRYYCYQVFSSFLFIKDFIISHFLHSTIW